MKAKLTKIPASYILPIYVSGLHGRMLRLPPKKNKTKEILVVYGEHSCLEQIYKLCQQFNKYGGVTAPDLPGFGGMKSFYKINEKPDLDNLADYVAALIKLRYSRRRLTIVGLSFGFSLVVKMLQKHPEIANKVDLVVGINGHVHHEDIKLKKPNYLVMRFNYNLMSKRLPSLVMKRILMQPVFVKSYYRLKVSNDPNLRALSAKRHKKHIDEAADLWRKNDIRTYMNTRYNLLNLNLCTKQVNMPLYYLKTSNSYYDDHVLEQHLKIIFKKVKMLKPVPHKPRRLPDGYMPVPLLPTELIQALQKT